MCGIFGSVGAAPTPPEALVETLSHLLHHRGPDDQGFESGPGWSFGFRRLSILDLSPLGHQPMLSPDGRYCILFNGEIYNYLELRQALERQGETFRGGSDTEVLLRLLAREGPEVLKRLNGMFGFALVDTERRTFLLARDRLGVKPLYYHQQPEQLRFASELKVLLAWPDAPREVDPAAVAEYLVLNYLSNDSCIFKGYQKLPPGHYLAGSLDNPGKSRPIPYWSLSLNPEEGEGTLSESDLDALLDLLTDAVRIRLRSDVPVGIFLSGGLDSGLVAALAARGAEGALPLALTVGFEEREYDESDLARATAQQTGMEHRLIVQQPGELQDVDRIAWFFDEPFGDSSALPTFALCEAAAQHATVFLGGDGGDEAFGGYRRYIEAMRYRWLTALPPLVGRGIQGLSSTLPLFSPLRFRLLKSSLPHGDFAAVFDTLPTEPALEAVLHPDLRALARGAARPLWTRWAQSRGASLTTRQQALDYSLYLPDDILTKMDRASMAHSIEVRSPFLDYRVVEWAARLPRATLLNATEGKLPLRALGKRLLPPTVQRGSKRGFGVPLDAWFREPAGHAFVRERLLSEEARRHHFWDVQGVGRVIEAHQRNGGRNFGFLLWRLLMLDSWSRHYLNGTRFLEGPPRAVRERV
ncbi:MAG: asparagine synthase (glutamine-hydrolyzing) [Ardenticatenales bacterium]|nr:asparagine synthase (glutamine-hydrolyzing) [Ardenticatenales bacterium]